MVTQWRTTPVAVDWNQDGLQDLIMLDHEGYLAFFQRVKRSDGLVLMPGARIFRRRVSGAADTPGDSVADPLLRFSSGEAGRSGRRKLCVVDWDGDGDLDLLVNSINATLLENVETRDGQTIFADRGPLGTRKLAGHTTSPTTVDWNRDGVPDFLVGAEDGRLYYLPHSDCTMQSSPQ